MSSQPVEISMPAGLMDDDMSHQQLGSDEVRLLRAIGTRTLSPGALAEARDLPAFSRLVEAGLVCLSNRTRIGVALTDRGREWLTVYGVKPR